MSIESRLPKEDEINIKDLHIEEPEAKPELAFDVEKEITEEDWNEIDDCLEKSRTGNHRTDLSNVMRRIKILNPDYTVTDEDKNNLIALFESARERFDMPGFFMHAKAIKILFPSQKITLDDEEKNNLLTTIEVEKDGSSWGSLWHDIQTYNLLFPNERLNISQKTIDDSKGLLLEFIRVDNWDGFTQTASEMKSCGIEISEFLNQDSWEKMKELMQRDRRSKNWDFFLWDASDLKILAAEKVEITSNGLEITMPKPKTELNKPTPPMPEIKKF